MTRDLERILNSILLEIISKMCHTLIVLNLLRELEKHGAAISSKHIFSPVYLFAICATQIS